MSRYIDRDAIVQDMKERLNNVNHGDYIYYRFGYKLAIRYIENAPTVDVQEVKHEKWVHYGEDIQCSNCGHVSDDICYEGDMDSGYCTVLPRYCSNCGARMDLEETNDERN